MQEYITYNNNKQYFGYIKDEAGTDFFCNQLAKIGHEPWGYNIVQSKFTDDEKKDVILPFYLYKAFPNWKAGSQGIGDCMSWSCAHTIDILMSVQAILKQLAEETPYQTCSEVMYGFMRIEALSKNEDRGSDGAYGGAAAKAVMKCGSLHRTIYKTDKNEYDFTTYSGKRAKEFGRTGVPNDIEEIARSHIVGTATMVTNFDDAAKFIMNGYPISNAHSSNPTFQGTRDNDGYGRGHGYAHAMNYVGIRWEPRPALLKTNTGWQDTVSGPMWPDQLNGNPSLVGCAWWEEAEICDKVLSGKDSFAYSQYTGFKKQTLPDFGTMSYL